MLNSVTSVTARIIIEFTEPSEGKNDLRELYATGGYDKKEKLLPRKEVGETLQLSIGEGEGEPVVISFEVVEKDYDYGHYLYHCQGVMPESERAALHDKFIASGYERFEHQGELASF